MIQKGFAHVFILIVLALFVVGGIGFYAYKNGQIKSVPQQTSPSPTPSLDPTANWRTYNNEKYGFEIKYPEKWQFKEFDISPDSEAEFWLMITNNQSSLNTQSLYYPWKDLSSVHKGLQIVVVPNLWQSWYLTRNKYNCNLEHEGCIFLFKYQPTAFLGLKANKAVAEFPDTPRLTEMLNMNDIQPYTYILFNNQGKGWVIAYNHSDFKWNYDSLFDQILSTFKFLDQKQSTSIPPGHSSELINVQFKQGANLGSPETLLTPDLQNSIVKIEPLFSLPTEKLDKIGASDLKRWFRVTLKESTNAVSFFDELRHLDSVEIAEFAPLPQPPP